MTLIVAKERFLVLNARNLTQGNTIWLDIPKSIWSPRKEPDIRVLNVKGNSLSLPISGAT